MVLMRFGRLLVVLMKAQRQAATIVFAGRRLHAPGAIGPLEKTRALAPRFDTLDLKEAKALLEELAS
jgi:hypothetical protein